MKVNNIIIPDRIFHKIWNVSCDYEEFSSFYNSITSIKSKEYIDLYKYALDLDLIYDTLRYIHKYSHYCFSDFLDDNKIKKASISHRFCIPIRTIENWCNGSGKCAPYIMLMILECYNVKYLPDNVYTDSLWKKFNTSKENSKKKINKKTNGNINENPNENNIEKYNKEDLGKLPLDDIDDLLDNINLETFSLRDFEQTHSIDNSSFLSDTDYLRKHMK
ncbi:hypothetical protein [Pseudobutyrivibrio ruminis]|uniref:hypothetical protein n=1 Tax=Pseudobutyrivibrio ruminis TaxID=46206 RepID=UPI000425859D|nr:hypothetical protein [Pseudobutyrivibrio ruminis]